MVDLGSVFFPAQRGRLPAGDGGVGALLLNSRSLLLFELGLFRDGIFSDRKNLGLFLLNFSDPRLDSFLPRPLVASLVVALTLSLPLVLVA
jgi:hypothetical protein